MKVGLRKGPFIILVDSLSEPETTLVLKVGQPESIVSEFGCECERRGEGEQPRLQGFPGSRCLRPGGTEPS